METKNLQNLTYEELCSLVQERKITWSEWVDAQPELYDGYDTWLAENNLARNDENAQRFISIIEDEDMLPQVDTTVTEASQTASQVRQGMK